MSISWVVGGDGPQGSRLIQASPNSRVSWGNATLMGRSEVDSCIDVGMSPAQCLRHRGPSSGTQARPYLTQSRTLMRLKSLRKETEHVVVDPRSTEIPTDSLRGRFGARPECGRACRSVVPMISLATNILGRQFCLCEMPAPGSCGATRMERRQDLNRVIQSTSAFPCISTFSPPMVNGPVDGFSGCKGSGRDTCRSGASCRDRRRCAVRDIGGRKSRSGHRGNWPPDSGFSRRVMEA
jgi:hypothetical protein